MTRINGQVLCEVGKLVCGEKGEEQAFLRQSLLQPIIHFTPVLTVTCKIPILSKPEKHN